MTAYPRGEDWANTQTTRIRRWRPPLRRSGLLGTQSVTPGGGERRPLGSTEEERLDAILVLRREIARRANLVGRLVAFFLFRFIISVALNPES